MTGDSKPIMKMELTTVNRQMMVQRMSMRRILSSHPCEPITPQSSALTFRAVQLVPKASQNFRRSFARSNAAAWCLPGLDSFVVRVGSHKSGCNGLQWLSNDDDKLQTW